MKHQNFNIFQTINLEKSKITGLCLPLQTIDYRQSDLFHGGTGVTRAIIKMCYPDYQI